MAKEPPHQTWVPYPGWVITRPAIMGGASVSLSYAVSEAETPKRCSARCKSSWCMMSYRLGISICTIGYCVQLWRCVQLWGGVSLILCLVLVIYAGSMLASHCSSDLSASLFDQVASQQGHPRAAELLSWQRTMPRLRGNCSASSPPRAIPWGAGGWRLGDEGRRQAGRCPKAPHSRQPPCTCTRMSGYPWEVLA